MTRRKFLQIAPPRIKKHLAESEVALTSAEIAEFLGVSTGTASGVLGYMETLGIIQHVKRGRNLYFLKGEESKIPAKPPPKLIKRRPKPRPPPIKRRNYTVLEEYIASVREQARTGEGPPALAVIGMTKTVEVDSPGPKPEPRPVKEPVTPEVKSLIFLKREPHGTIEFIPSDFRLLTQGQTKHLKENHLRELDGYEKIEAFSCIFADRNSLSERLYGTVFYASKGTNPWDRVYKVVAESRSRGAS